MRVVAAAASAALLLVPLASAATFGRSAEIPIGTQPVAVSLGDATQDGMQDVVLASTTAPGMSILPGRGDGSFERPLQHPEAAGARAFVFGDFDGDGADELAVATASAIGIYAGVDGNLTRRQTYAVPGPTSLAASDLDTDGNLDLLATSAARSAVFVLHGRGDDTFDPPAQLAIGSPASAVVIADLNDDGAPDIAAAGSSLSVLFGNGDGTFAPYRGLAGPSGLRGIGAQDLDGDGDMDLAVAGGLNQVSVLFNDGAGGFAPMNGIDAPQPVVCLVPRVARRTFATARGIVTRAHCTVAPIRRVYSNRVRRGRVIAQSPVPGVRAPEGAPVTLVVSRGPRR